MSGYCGVEIPETPQLCPQWDGKGIIHRLVAELPLHPIIRHLRQDKLRLTQVSVWGIMGLKLLMSHVKTQERILNAVNCTPSSRTSALYFWDHSSPLSLFS